MSIDERRRELVLGNCGGQKLADALTQKLFFEDLSHAWAANGVFDQHVGQQVFQVLRVVRWYLGIIASENFEHQALHAVSVEGMAQCHHLIQNAAERPDVRLLVVRFFLADLWREVVRCANGSLCTVVSVLQHSRNSEVADLYRPVLVHENVLGLQVTMQDLTVVYVLDGQSHLHEPVEDLVLTVAHFAIFLFFRNQGVQVTTVGVVHDDAQTPLVHKGLTHNLLELQASSQVLPPPVTKFLKGVTQE